MKPQTTTLTKPTLDLPKSWENTRVSVDFPDSATVVVKRLGNNQEAIDYAIDEKNWSKVKDSARIVRDEVFKQFYPELYGAKQNT